MPLLVTGRQIIIKPYKALLATPPVGTEPSAAVTVDVHKSPFRHKKFNDAQNNLKASLFANCETRA
jgi:hypothetical protein